MTTGSVDSGLLDLLADNLSTHSFGKHAKQFLDQRSNGARNKPSESRGEPIKMDKPSDMANHIKDTLRDPDTKYVLDEKTGRMTFFNSKTNTMIVFNPGQMTNGDGLAGTVMRTEQRLGDRDFQREVEKIRAAGGNPQVGSVADGKWDDHIGKYRPQIQNGLDNARTPPRTPATPDTINKIKNAPDAQTIIDPRSGTTYMYSAEQKAMLVIGADGKTMVDVTNAAAHYKYMFNDIGEATGKMPQVIKGGIEGLKEFLEGGAGQFLGKHADEASAIAKWVGKLSKVLPLVGAVAAGIELYQFMDKATTAHSMGVLSRQALGEYTAICCGNGAASFGGIFTSTGGEAAAIIAFNAWADKYNVPQYLREELKPQGLLSIGLDAARNVASRENTIAASGDTMVSKSTDYVTRGGEGSPRHESLVYTAQDLPLGPTELSDVPPEMQALVSHVQSMQNLERQKELLPSGGAEYLRLSEQQMVAEQNFAEALQEMASTGGITHALDYSRQYMDSLRITPKALEALPASDIRVPDNGAEQESSDASSTDTGGVQLPGRQQFPGGGF